MPATAVLAYVGDAVRAAGFRLAGAHVFAPAPGAELEALEQARATAQVVLLSPAVALRLPRAELEAAMIALQPMVAIVPENGTLSSADPAARVRAQLGLEA